MAEEWDQKLPQGLYRFLSETDKSRIEAGWILCIPAKCFHPKNRFVDPRIDLALYKGLPVLIMVTYFPATQPEVPWVNVVLVHNVEDTGRTSQVVDRHSQIFPPNEGIRSMSFALDVKQVPSASGERLPKLDANRGYQYVAGVVNYTIDLDVLYIKSAEERRLWQPDMKHFYKNMNAEGEDSGKYHLDRDLLEQEAAARLPSIGDGTGDTPSSPPDEYMNDANNPRSSSDEDTKQEAAARSPSIKSETFEKAFGGDGAADTPSSPPDHDMNDANNPGSPSDEAIKQEWDDEAGNAMLEQRASKSPSPTTPFHVRRVSFDSINLPDMDMGKNGTSKVKRCCCHLVLSL